MDRTERERLERFCQAFLQTQSPERAGQMAGVKAPMALLKSGPCQRELARQRELLEGALTKADVLRRMAALAFGRANDCVRLALDPEAEIGTLDLDLLAELKRSEKGAVEVKLTDRTALLQALLAHTSAEQTSMDDLLRAMGQESP